MNLRNSDFGISIKTYKSICQRIQNGEIQEHDLLNAAAVEANQSISEYLVKSIEESLSYEKMSAGNYIPINKNDFYAYRRECISSFYKKLTNRGKYVYEQNDR